MPYANLNDTANHPAGTTYDVLIPSHAARRRGVSIEDAIAAWRTMRAEGVDPIVVAHLPTGERIVGCTGTWEPVIGTIDGSTIHNSSNVTATVIFDNSGGVTVQLTNGSESWAHYYDSDLRAAAGDVHAALYTGEFGTYDGDEPNAHECSPTAEEIRNGGYRVERFESVTQFEEYCLADHSDSGWGNIRELTEWVRRGEL